MAPKALLVALVGFASLAGCLDPSLNPGSPLDDVVAPFLAPELSAALWNDPQFFPHPDFNWPTLTHVPANAPAWWQAIPMGNLPADVKVMKHVAQAGTGSAGDGLAVFGSLVINPSGVILDVRDPARPEVLADIDVQPSGRNAAMMAFPDGRLFVAFSTGSGMIPVWDITDPRKPVEASVIDVPSGGHTISVVPGTPILYNANAVGSRYYPHELSGGKSLQQVEIYDLSDPYEPSLVQVWEEGLGCHEISFYLNPGKLRGYCAAVDSTQIWDLTNPREPRVVVTIPAPHGLDPLPGLPILAAVSHYVVVNRDATVMGVADEFLGGIGPGCDTYQRVAGKTVSGVAGNVHFFDIRDERNPVLKGWVNPGSHFTYNPGGFSCTAHIGHMVPQESKDLMAMSFYSGGVALIDFTDAANPFIQDAWQQTTPMDVWYYNGYLFAGDASKGIDVLSLA